MRRMNVKTTRRAASCSLAVVATAVVMMSDARAGLTYSAYFVDPTSAAAPYYPSILSAIDSSLRSWSSYIGGSADLSVELEVTAGVPRATGGSLTSGFVRNNGTYNVFEQGAAFKIR